MAAASRSQTVWFVPVAPRLQADWRILCFPYAGGGPSLFREWSCTLPPSVDVWGIHLPARESRLVEAPFTRLLPLAEAVADAITAAACDTGMAVQRFAMFGHSLGALLAFEVARELRRRDGPRPSCLLCSGCHAPQIAPTRTPIHQLSADQFLQKLRDLNGSPGNVLDNVELMDVVLPSLRADFEMCETYDYRPGEPLDASIAAFAGMEDPEVMLDDVAAWRDQTNASFQLHLLPGDHFFVNTARDQLLRVLLGCLR
jgi:medium-chain acyl-[acyl-carrier-protein] hydrolase